MWLWSFNAKCISAYSELQLCELLTEVLLTYVAEMSHRMEFRNTFS